MNPKPPLCAALSLLLLGCSAPLHLYPVQGPLAAQQPLPVLTARATGLTSGTISFTLPSGEACAGPWAPIRPGQVEQSLAPTWDSVYGPGHYLAHVLGSQWHGQARLTGNQGTRMHLEFYRDTVPDAPLQGVARDEAGNVYKVGP